MASPNNPATTSPEKTEKATAVEDITHNQRGEEYEYITGWRLHVLTLVLCICVFISQLESTITSTSVITITDDLGGYVKNSWILTAYWLTSGAFQIIWAKLSDIVGRKVAIMTAIFLFAVWSGACGASQTVLQLIQFRWLQGIGGCGVMALGQLTFFDLLPPSKYVAYTTLVTCVITSSLITGPLIGGGITLHREWRWVFLVNVPIGAVALVIIGWLLPRPFSTEPAARRSETKSIGQDLFERLDIFGTFLLLGSCALLITGLQQAAIGYSFSSPFVLPLLICSGPFCITFFTWQWYITTRKTQPEPVFPWRFCTSRIRMGTIATSWFSGGVVSTCIFQIPQRYMTTNGDSPFTAAARLLTFGGLITTGSGLTGILLRRFQLRPFIVILCGACLQLIGTALLARIPSGYHIRGEQYAYQIIIGLGLGLVLPAIIYTLPHIMENRDLAVGTAAVSQFRMLGGLIAVSIGASITTRNLISHLKLIVPSQTLGLILQRTEAIKLLPADVVQRVRPLFGNAYDLQMDLATGLAAAQVLAAAMMWTRENYSKRDQSNASSNESEDGSPRGVNAE